MINNILLFKYFVNLWNKKKYLVQNIQQYRQIIKDLLEKRNYKASKLCWYFNKSYYAKRIKECEKEYILVIESLNKLIEKDYSEYIKSVEYIAYQKECPHFENTYKKPII